MHMDIHIYTLHTYTHTYTIHMYTYVHIYVWVYIHICNVYGYICIVYMCICTHKVHFMYICYRFCDVLVFVIFVISFLILNKYSLLYQKM